MLNCPALYHGTLTLAKFSQRPTDLWGSIRRNLNRCPTNIKRQAYLSFVRPHLEYASSVWDPHLQKHIYQIEMVQRRAGRFIKQEYSRDPGIVTSILQELELQALQERRKTSRLLICHKIAHQKVAIPLPPYLQKPTRTTRQYHPRRFVRIGSTGDQQHSLFVRTIKDWNDLPPDILGIYDYEAFKTSLIVHRSQSNLTNVFKLHTCTYVFNEHMMDDVQYYAFVWRVTRPFTNYQCRSRSRSTLAEHLSPPPRILVGFVLLDL